MKNILQKSFFIIAFCWLVVGMTGCSRQPEIFSSIDTAMGTVIAQQIYVKEDGSILAAKDATDPTTEIITLMNQLEQETLSWRVEDSELARINALSGDREEHSPQTLTPQMADILADCMEVSEKSGGAFDITIGSVSRLWNLDEWADKWQEEEYPLPASEEIEVELAHSGYKNIILMQEANSVDTDNAAPVTAGDTAVTTTITLQNGVTLDLGAVGKGIALDGIHDYLNSDESITGAVITAGGSILTYGQKPDGSAWKVGIVDPLDNSRNLGVLTLTGQWCVSTSGDYERFVEVGGKRYHHIIDPANGYPADSGVRSVTIVCKDGFLSDALSTACFILGEEKGMALAKEYGAEALFVDADGNITMTEGMRVYFSQ